MFFENAICPSHPSVIESAAQFENRSMVGADGRTPIKMLRGGGVQRFLRDPGKKVLLLPLGLASRKRYGCQVRLFGLIGVQVHLVVKHSSEHPLVSLLCRTVRQLSGEDIRVSLFEVAKEFHGHPTLDMPETSTSR